jgi:hypothetical protein
MKKFKLKPLVIASMIGMFGLGFVTANAAPGDANQALLEQRLKAVTDADSWSYELDTDGTGFRYARYNDDYIRQPYIPGGNNNWGNTVIIPEGSISSSVGGGDKNYSGVVTDNKSDVVVSENLNSGYIDSRQAVEGSINTKTFNINFSKNATVAGIMATTKSLLGFNVGSDKYIPVMQNDGRPLHSKSKLNLTFGSDGVVNAEQSATAYSGLFDAIGGLRMNGNVDTTVSVAGDGAGLGRGDLNWNNVFGTAGNQSPVNIAINAPLVKGSKTYKDLMGFAKDGYIHSIVVQPSATSTGENISDDTVNNLAAIISNTGAGSKVEYKINGTVNQASKAYNNLQTAASEAGAENLNNSNYGGASSDPAIIVGINTVSGSNVVSHRDVVDEGSVGLEDREIPAADSSDNLLDGTKS